MRLEDICRELLTVAIEDGLVSIGEQTNPDPMHLTNSDLKRMVIRLNCLLLRRCIQIEDSKYIDNLLQRIRDHDGVLPTIYLDKVGGERVDES